MLPTIVDTKVISPGASFLIVTACLVVVATGMKAAAPILVPFLLALFIALISAPPLLWLQDRGVPRGLALLIVISLQVGCCLVLAAVLTRSVNDFTQSMPEYQASMKQQVVYLVNALERWGIEP